MRIGVSSRGTWWLSMGPVGWILYLLFVAPILLILWLAVALIQLVVWCIDAARAKRN